MAILLKLYHKVVSLAEHPKAPLFLGGISFCEASFFPIPPDALLAPMVLAKPFKAWRLALLTTVWSVFGALLGYYIGLHCFEWLARPFMEHHHLMPQYQVVSEWFAHYGVWAVIGAGITPIPFKLFTVCAGAGSMPLVPFVVAACIGRGVRFYSVSAVLRYSHRAIESHLIKALDKWGWWCLLAMVIMLLLWWGI